MDDIMKDMDFSRQGCLADECLVQAGLILGTTQMVSGTVTAMLLISEFSALKRQKLLKL